MHRCLGLRQSVFHVCIRALPGIALGISHWGCARASESHPPAALAAECTSRRVPRWTGPWGPVHGFIGDPGTDGSAGVAFGDSTLFVFERRLGEVRLFDVGGVPSGSFGREGQGPGEFMVRGFTRLLPRVVLEPISSWIDLRGDTVAVFDGNAIQRFTSRGMYVDEVDGLAKALSGSLRFSRRIRLVPEGVVIDVEARTGERAGGEDRPRPYGVWLVTDSSASRVVSLNLRPLPRPKVGRFRPSYEGPLEAQPIWDLLGGCVVVSDGSSPWLLVANLHGGRVDTIPIPLPMRRPASSRKTVDPSTPMHLSDLIADPDGWIWILPVQADGRLRADTLEILRVGIGLGVAVFDTVPAFPTAFGPPGVAFGTRRDADGNTRLATFVARSQ
jgi:hypothetical protein